MQLITAVNSLISDFYITHLGTMHVTNEQSGYTAAMSFGDPGSGMTNFAKTRQAKNLQASSVMWRTAFTIQT